MGTLMLQASKCLWLILSEILYRILYLSHTNIKEPHGSESSIPPTIHPSVHLACFVLPEKCHWYENKNSPFWKQPTNWPTDRPASQTNSMEQSLSWEVNSRSTSQDIPWLLWNPKAHYCVHKSLPLVPILSQMNAVHSFPPYFSKINSNIIQTSHTFSIA
jgi:hypothetical protein